MRCTDFSIFSTRAALVLFGLHSCLGGLGSSCSSGDIDDGDPVALMADAEDDIDSSRYIIAIEKLQLVKNKHPYSKQAIDAALRLGDVYYMQENFAEAAATYEAFADLHPKHEKIPYALYRVALSHFSDAPDLIARDLSALKRAEEAFKYFLEKFPASEFSPDAKAKLAEARKKLAEKELYIANFYYKREMWEAAKGRFQKILSDYPDCPYIEEAESKLKQIETKEPKA